MVAKMKLASSVTDCDTGAAGKITELENMSNFSVALTFKSSLSRPFANSYKCACENLWR